MPAHHWKLSLFLADPLNDWIRTIANDAAEAARRRGFTLSTQFSENQAVEQIQQVFTAIRAPQAERPDAILVMPVHDQSLERVARAAAVAGVAWVCLHRATGDLAALRREFPEVPILLVGPDQEEIGRIQGRQLLGMLPHGGRVLSVVGRHDNLSTAQRTSGLREVLQGSTVEVAAVVDGNWSAMDAEQAVGRWLRLLSARTPVDVIACQNDAMAIGARHAARDAAAGLGRPSLAEIPILGCDGLPHVGRRLVDSRELAATIVLPTPAGAAIEAVTHALETRRMPPERVLLTPQPYPARPGGLPGIVHRPMPDTRASA